MLHAGMFKMSTDTIDKLRKKLPELRGELHGDDKFRDIYNYAYKFSCEVGCCVVMLAVATLVCHGALLGWLCPISSALNWGATGCAWVAWMCSLQRECTVSRGTVPAERSRCMQCSMCLVSQYLSPLQQLGVFSIASCLC